MKAWIQVGRYNKIFTISSETERSLKRKKRKNKTKTKTTEEYSNKQNKQSLNRKGNQRSL